MQNVSMDGAVQQTFIVPWWRILNGFADPPLQQSYLLKIDKRYLKNFWINLFVTPNHPQIARLYFAIDFGSSSAESFTEIVI